MHGIMQNVSIYQLGLLCQERTYTKYKGIKHAELDSQQVDIDKGFKQGCVLAPELFNVYLDTVVRQLLPFLQQNYVRTSFSINGQLQQKQNPLTASCFGF